MSARLTVVLVAEREGPELEGRIEELEQRFRHAQPEILVAVGGTPPRARALAAHEARGNMLAFLSERYRPGPDWLAAVASAADEGTRAMTGPVGMGLPGSGMDWAWYLCEYARPAHASPPLVGGNHALEASLARELGEAWEWEIDRMLRERRVTVRHDPAMEVSLVSAPRPVAERFRFSRSWARAQVRERGLPQRLRRLAGAAAQPLVHGSRIASACRDSPQWRARLPQAVPGLAALLAAGACGEAVGSILTRETQTSDTILRRL